MRSSTGKIGRMRNFSVFNIFTIARRPAPKPDFSYQHGNRKCDPGNTEPYTVIVIVIVIHHQLKIIKHLHRVAVTKFCPFSYDLFLLLITFRGRNFWSDDFFGRSNSELEHKCQQQWKLCFQYYDRK